MARFKDQLRSKNNDFYRTRQIPPLMKKQMLKSAEEGKLSHVFKCSEEEREHQFTPELINLMTHEGLKLSYAVQEGIFHLIVSWE